jgi:hypothetical protein
MALITKVTPSVDLKTAQNAPQITGLYAGEALAICAPCYIASADGLVYQTDATAANEAAEVAGFTARAVAIGEPVTLFGLGTRMRYGAGLTPGDILYAGATAGRLDGATTVGDAMGVAMVVTATDIVVTRAQPSVLTTTADASITGTKAAVVANDNVIGGLPLIFAVAIAGGAAAKNVTMTHKVRVLDAWAQHTGGAGEANDTITVGNAGNAISDAMDWSGADNVIVRAGEINDANATINAGGSLRVTTTDNDAGGDVGAGIVHVLAIRVS